MSPVVECRIVVVCAIYNFSVAFPTDTLKFPLIAAVRVYFRVYSCIHVFTLWRVDKTITKSGITKFLCSFGQVFKLKIHIIHRSDVAFYIFCCSFATLFIFSVILYWLMSVYYEWLQFCLIRYLKICEFHKSLPYKVCLKCKFNRLFAIC